MSLFSLFDDSAFSQFDRMFDEAFNRRNESQLQRQSDNAVAPRAFRPLVDVHEDKEKNLVTATFELPGVAKDAVRVDIRNDRLTVSGETKSEYEENKNGHVVRERRFGRFSRTLPVPVGIKPDDIKASMENGILTVTYPSQTPEQAPKRITIS